MTVVEETEALRATLLGWAAEPEWALLCKYDLLRKKQPTTLGTRLFRWCKKLLAEIGIIHPHVTKYVWVSTLKNVPSEENSTTMLIWALGITLEDQRAACEGFIKRLSLTSGIVPVLVTDIADFAYYSRLKWLVEYVPSLSGKGGSYRKRKERYLAWRYRDAKIVPVSAGYASEVEWYEVMEMK